MRLLAFSRAQSTNKINNLSDKFSFVFTLGATFDQNKKLNTAILEYAVKTANEKILSQSDIELKYTVELLDYGNEFIASESVCRLLEVISLICPISLVTSPRFLCVCLSKFSLHSKFYRRSLRIPCASFQTFYPFLF